MTGFFTRFRHALLLFALLLTALVLMTRSAGERRGFRGPAVGLFEVSAALESGISAVTSGALQIYEGTRDLMHAREENRVLRGRVARLENRLHRLAEIELENRRLLELLDFQESVPFVMIPARVTGKDFNSWSRTLVIDQGTKAGIAEGMAVVRPEGVVGRILSASPNYALVQLMIDSNSDIPVIFQRTRTQAVVEGKITHLCRAKYLNRLADIRPGDAVISSGLGGIYPKGLRVGTVASVEKKPYGLFQDVTVRPAVDFSRLEEVFVVKNERLREYDLQLKRHPG